MEMAFDSSPSYLNAEERLSFRLWFQRQFTERCKRNPRYSLRAFAKSLEMDPSSVSQILKGRRHLSRKAMMAVCDKLGATAADLAMIGVGAKSANAQNQFHLFSLDTVAVVSDWVHYAILELTFVAGFKPDQKWIARKLGITVDEARAAVERLIRLELLAEKDGTLVKVSRQTSNIGPHGTDAHKQLQRQFLEKALRAVDECSPEKKDITAMTMAIDVTQIDLARELIRNFRRDLCNRLESGQQTEVYNLGIQLYPLSTDQSI